MLPFPHDEWKSWEILVLPVKINRRVFSEVVFCNEFADSNKWIDPEESQRLVHEIDPWNDGLDIEPDQVPDSFLYKIHEPVT